MSIRSQSLIDLAGTNIFTEHSPVFSLAYYTLASIGKDKVAHICNGISM